MKIQNALGGVLSVLLALTSISASAAPASANAPTITLTTTTANVVSGTSAIFTPSGADISWDFSDLRYEVKTSTGGPLKVKFDYRTESSSYCLGETLLVSGGYDYCRYESKSKLFSIPVAIATSSSMTAGQLTITVLENVSELLQVRAWIDVNQNGFRDAFEPYSQTQTLRNYAPGELPALLEYSFDPPVWGERFSATVGMTRVNDVFIYGSNILDESKLQLEVQQGDQTPVVSISSGGMFVPETPFGYLSEPQMWYFDNVGTSLVAAGGATTMEIGLFVQNGSPWSSAADGTYITAQLQSYDNDTGTYGSIAGAPTAALNTDASGVVDVLVTPDASVSGSGRLLMKYYSYDGTAIGASYIPLTFSGAGSYRNGSGWKRQVFSTGVAKSHVSEYVMRLYYEANGARYLIGERSFDYSKFSVSKVIPEITSDGEAYEFDVDTNFSERSYTMPADARAFSYSIRVLDDNSRPKADAPVFIEVNLQDYSGLLLDIDGRTVAFEEGLTLERTTDANGMVRVDFDFPSTFTPGPYEAIQLVPQVYGMKGSNIPGLDRDRTVVSWQLLSELYLDATDLTNTNGAASIDFLVTNQNRAGVSHPILFTAGFPLQLSYSSLTTSSSGTISVNAIIAPGVSGSGTAPLTASIFTDGELKQLSWNVLWDADDWVLKFEEGTVSSGQPSVRLKNEVGTKVYWLEVFETASGQYSADLEIRNLDGSFVADDIELFLESEGVQVIQATPSKASNGKASFSFSSTDLSKSGLNLSASKNGTIEEVISIGTSQSVLLGGKEVELSHPSLVRTGQEFELRINPQTSGLSLGELSVTSSSADATVTKLAADADGYYANVVVKESTADSLTLNLMVDTNNDGDFSDESDQFLKISIPMFYATTSAIGKSVNAGSFKGHVAIYAKGYEGRRLTAKVGNDWVVVTSIPKSTNDLYRLVDYTGAGQTISVRIYIDRVLIRTVELTTK